MTDKELKEYALVGILVRLDAEQKKLPLATEQSQKVMIETRIDILTQHYNAILNDLRQQAGI